MAYRKKEDNIQEEVITQEEEQPKTFKEIVAEAKKKAMKKRIVTIIYNDKRDNDQVNTAFLTCENQFFALSKVVPLNIPVELEQCLIDTAKEAKILLHVPYVKDGVNTGVCKYRFINKYSVSYEDMSE